MANFKWGLWHEVCCRCKTEFAFSDEIHTAALQRRESFMFYCPNGHQQCYVTGETDESKLRRERDRYKQQLAQRDDEIATQSKLIANLQKQNKAVTRKVERANHGVCTECNRSFVNVARHMATKHQFKAEMVA
jgi:hypothetical protein